MVSAQFSKELTKSVIWLNERGLDIECVRMKPYRDGGRILVDIQQIIPLPEAEDNRVKLREKQERERGARKSNRDFTRYDVVVDNHTHEHLSKKLAIVTIVRHLTNAGHSPEAIAAVIPWRRSIFQVANDELNSDAFVASQTVNEVDGDRAFDERKWFSTDEELIHYKGET